MKIREIITEQKSDETLEQEITHTLPSAYSIPQLKNQDPYLQYRFGVAIAGAKGAAQRAKDEVPEYASKSVWGESEIVVSYGEDVGPYIDDALKTMNIKGKKRTSTVTSDEPLGVQPHSPVKPFKGYSK